MLIIATVEKYLLSEGHIKKLILAGADALRFNLSYRTIEENLNFISITQKIAEELNASTKTFIDLPTTKPRLGDFELKLFPVNEGDELVFKSGSFTADCREYMPVNIDNLGDKLAVNQSITIGDGEVSLQVIEVIDRESVKVRVQNHGVIEYMKTLNIPTEIDEEKIIKTYTAALKKLQNTDFQYLAFSYHNYKLFKKIVEIIHQENTKAKIVVNIEKEIPLDQIEQLCQDVDVNIILIDRGDLGVNLPYYRTGIYQKNIIQIAKKFKKPVIISTQILESTIDNFIPNRSEISDLTDHVLAGIDGIILCRETAINNRAAYTLSVAKKIINEVEKYKNDYAHRN